MWDLLERLDILFGLGAFVFSVYNSVRLRGLGRKPKSWQVVVIQNGEILFKRKIGTKKLKLIQEDSQDLAVYLKGVMSPYGRLSVDLLRGAQKLVF